MADVCFSKPKIAMNGHMLTRFGLLIDFDLLKALTSTYTKLEAVVSGGCRHVANPYDVILPPWVCTKFISLTDTAITVMWSIMKPEVEFQYGGRLFLQTGSSYNSAVNCGI